MNGLQRYLHIALLLLALAVLGGCAAQQLRDESEALMREAKYEQALELLEGGVQRYPQNPLLRSGLVQARNEAFTRLVAQANSERAAGQLEAAQASLRRAQLFDTSGQRASTLLEDLAVDRRQREALQQAQALASTQPQAALSVISEALKDNPRHVELVSLQRRLMAESRWAQARAAQLGLAETRPISLDFRDIGLRTVLDVVTRNSGVNFVLDKDIRQDVRVTVYLRSARVEDAIDLIISTHQLAKKVLDERTILVYPNTPDKQREYQEQVVRVFHLASAEAKGAAAFLRSMLRIREPFVDERSNMLAIREPAEVIELAERLVALYDTGDAELLLEVEVLEVRSTRLLDLGIQFPDSIGLTPLTPGGGATGLTLGDLRGFNADRVGVSVGGLLLNLKREVGDFNTIANPRIRVRNREKAKVLIGDKVPVVTTTTSQAGFVADSVNYLDVGLKLDVEPTVFVDDEVAIRINMEVSSLSSSVQTKSGSLAYQIGTRSASTLLRLRDGETQLLAGLISRDERSSANRLPGLGDLPVLGRLFSSQHDEAQKTELVLAITPRILRNLRRPDAAEAELWVGTETMPRVRPVGGLAPLRMAPGGTGTTADPATAASERASARAATSAPSSDAPAPATTAPLIALSWEGPTAVRVGETFTLLLRADTRVPLRGAPMQLAYNPAQLQFIDAEEGALFRRDAAATSFTKSAAAATPGQLRAGVLRNEASGIVGSGTVLALRFRAVSPGRGEVVLQSFDAVAIGEAPPPALMPAPFVVELR